MPSAPLVWTFDGRFARCLEDMEDTLRRAIVQVGDVSRIIVAIDQTLITPGALAPLQRTASEFIGRLTPADYAGFVAFPEPGPRVDFTTDKARVRKALEGIIGQPARIFSGDFNIGYGAAALARMVRCTDLLCAYDVLAVLASGVLC